MSRVPQQVALSLLSPLAYSYLAHDELAPAAGEQAEDEGRRQRRPRRHGGARPTSFLSVCCSPAD